MIYRALADAVVLVHLLFIAFVVSGAFAVAVRPRLVWVHVPAVAWGALVEINAWTCPLTPLEIRLRAAAGEQGYHGGFIEHYVIPLIYPAGLTPRIQLGLGLVVLLVNLAVYGTLVLRRRRPTVSPRHRPRPK